MKTTTYTLELITPCFCAGADQAKAEIRPSSIRGQLRWWFRALGNTREEEDFIFGNINKNEGTASTVIIRIQILNQGFPWNPPKNLPRDHGFTYIMHFVNASNNKIRWTEKGSIPPSTTFKLIVVQKSDLNPHLQEKLNLAVECFCRIGCFGLRATRGLGSMSLRSINGVDTHESETSLLSLKTKLKPYLHDFILRDKPFSKWEEVIGSIGSMLDSIRKDQQAPGVKKSPLGCASPRQTSSIYFRPVMINNKYQILIFRAPNHVLGTGINPNQIDLSHLN